MDTTNRTDLPEYIRRFYIEYNENAYGAYDDAYGAYDEFEVYIDRLLQAANSSVGPKANWKKEGF